MAVSGGRIKRLTERRRIVGGNRKRLRVSERASERLHPSEQKILGSMSVKQVIDSGRKRIFMSATMQAPVFFHHPSRVAGQIQPG